MSTFIMEAKLRINVPSGKGGAPDNEAGVPAEYVAMIGKVLEE
jgi:hypothetical protein